MKALLAIFSLTTCLAHAQIEERTAKASHHNGAVTLGFGSGGTSFGLGYEYMYDQSAGVGGHMRIYQKDDTSPGTSNGLTIAGASMSHHFYKRSWDLSLSPSFNIINIDSVRPNGSKSTMGPGLSISIMTQITDMISIGFDNSRFWVWFNDEYRGLAIDDFAFRLRASF